MLLLQEMQQVKKENTNLKSQLTKSDEKTTNFRSLLQKLGEQLRKVEKENKDLKIAFQVTFIYLLMIWSNLGLGSVGWEVVKHWPLTMEGELLNQHLRKIWIISSQSSCNYRARPQWWSPSRIGSRTTTPWPTPFAPGWPRPRTSWQLFKVNEN